MNIIFGIDGGLGKSILATAIIKAIKKKHPKSHLVVISAYPDVFLHNPHVNRCVKGDSQTPIYKEYIKDQNSKVFVANPYHTNDFILHKKHLLEIWCDMFGLTYKGEMPEIFLTQSELQYYQPFYKSDKPLLALHTNGGGSGQPQQYSWARDFPAPFVNTIIDYFKKDYTICHIKHKGQPSYPDTLAATDDYRSITILLMNSSKRLLIDSFSQHLAAALNLPSVVGWVTTSPDVFGYEMHYNILANPFTINPLYNHMGYQPFGLFEDIKNIPYKKLEDIFEPETFIKNILSL
tara:strand:- start:1744 stop:2619 length:876 start_codon:yes stop_codon:yes gene_type:complete